MGGGSSCRWRSGPTGGCSSAPSLQADPPVSPNRPLCGALAAPPPACVYSEPLSGVDGLMTNPVVSRASNSAPRQGGKQSSYFCSQTSERRAATWRSGSSCPSQRPPKVQQQPGRRARRPCCGFRRLATAAGSLLTCVRTPDWLILLTTNETSSHSGSDGPP